MLAALPVSFVQFNDKPEGELNELEPPFALNTAKTEAALVPQNR